MPVLDYALVCDYVRAEGPLSHIVAANIDTILVSSVPTARNVGVVVVLKFTKDESGREHGASVRFFAPSGEQLLEATAAISVEPEEDLPEGWPVTGNLGMNIGLPLPEYGEYRFEVVIEDAVKKVMRVRVVELPPPPS
jgi:hypothetical protein